MKKRYREMVNTRKVYAAEALMYEQWEFDELTKQRSLTYLRRLANRIWKGEKCKVSMPEIRFGSGISHGDSQYSWCDGETIELVPTQQDILTLIHELVHAIGCDYHNREFVEIQTYLLKKYTKTDKELITEAFNIW